MAQVLTLLSIVGVAAYVYWRFGDRLFDRSGIAITLRLDRAAPGAHLIWRISNTGAQPITLTQLVIHGSQGLTDMAARGLPTVLEPTESVVVFTDVDWSLLAAKRIAVTDSAGHEHTASRRQLVAIQDLLRQLIERRAYQTSARDFITGAADLAFGVVILGLGFFMLMWVIATG